MNQYTKHNFPHSNEINSAIFDFKFNELLNTIFWKMSNNNILPVNTVENCIKINNNEIAHTPQLINHVKKFLLDKGYKIIEIEENNINTGWKILWSD